MRNRKRFSFLHYGLLVTVILSVLLGYNLFVGDRQFFLPGMTTHGHHQIEMQCTACHVQTFTSGEPMQQACMSCHGEALERARDTHPKKKFTDPRNAALLANLDATQCVTCHVEHSPEITAKYGVTMPEDFCFFCHQDIAEDRPSHEGFEFDTCSDAGCHNYHDNKALYEKFLAKHLDEPAVLQNAVLRMPNAVAIWSKKNESSPALTADQHDGSEIEGHSADIVKQWSASVHAQVQVNCSDCHDNGNWSEPTHASSVALLEINACGTCHERQLEGFKLGMHGLRVHAGMTPMQVKEARIPMQADAMNKTLACSSCHDPHQPDLKAAAVDACLGCHTDEHSLNYLTSPHAQLWKAELAGQASPGSGVSCASCHLPRIKKGKRVSVEHNQNQTLEPNSKMLRPVCLECHGMEFSLAALTDDMLIQSNFATSANRPHPSFELVRKRIEDRTAKRRKGSE